MDGIERDILRIEQEIKELIEIVRLFNSAYKHSIFAVLTSFTIGLVSHMYTIHMFACKNLVIYEHTAVIPFYGKILLEFMD